MAQKNLIQMKIRTGQILRSVDRLVLVTKTKKIGEQTFEGTVISSSLSERNTSGRKPRIEHRKDWVITAFVKCGQPHDYEIFIIHPNFH